MISAGKRCTPLEVGTKGVFPVQTGAAWVGLSPVTAVHWPMQESKHWLMAQWTSCRCTDGVQRVLTPAMRASAMLFVRSNRRDPEYQFPLNWVELKWMSASLGWRSAWYWMVIYTTYTRWTVWIQQILYRSVHTFYKRLAVSLDNEMQFYSFYRPISITKPAHLIEGLPKYSLSTQLVTRTLWFHGSKPRQWTGCGQGTSFVFTLGIRRRPFCWDDLLSSTDDRYAAMWHPWLWKTLFPQHTSEYRQLKTSSEHVICPQCGTILQIWDLQLYLYRPGGPPQGWHFRLWEYFCVLQTVNGNGTRKSSYCERKSHKESLRGCTNLE